MQADTPDQLTALYQAAVDTTSLALANEIVEVTSRMIESFATSVNLSGWQRTSSLAKCLAYASRFTVFAYGAQQSGPAATLTGLVAGAATEQATETLGKIFLPSPSKTK